MGLRTFVPLVAACPGCGRTTSTTFHAWAGTEVGIDLDTDLMRLAAGGSAS